MTDTAENDALPNGCCHPPADHSKHVRHTAESGAPTYRHRYCREHPEDACDECPIPPGSDAP